MSIVRKTALVAGGTTLALLGLAGTAAAQTTTTGSSGINYGFVIVFGVAFAVACGLIAKNKNRNVALWAILGFLFGFIPLIIIAVLKKQEPTYTGAGGAYGGGGGAMPPPPPPAP